MGLSGVEGASASSNVPGPAQDKVELRTKLLEMIRAAEALKEAIQSGAKSSVYEKLNNLRQLWSGTPSKTYPYGSSGGIYRWAEHKFASNTPIGNAVGVVERQLNKQLVQGGLTADKVQGLINALNGALGAASA